MKTNLFKSDSFTATTSKKTSALKCLLICYLSSYAGSLLAFDNMPRVKISGFMTVGGAISDAEDFGEVNDPSDSEDRDNDTGETPRYLSFGNNYLINDDFDFNAVTRAGMQVDFQISEETRATLQIASRGNIDNYDPDLSWLYISHQLSAFTTVKAGRFRVPLYFVSASLDVGLTYPWITPPAEIYSLINMSNMVGFDLVHNGYVGDWIWSVQPYAGTSDFDRGDGISKFRNMLGVRSTLMNDYLTMQVAYLQYDFAVADRNLSEETNAALDLLTELELFDVIDHYDPDGTKSQFFSAGFELRYNKVKAWGEGARRSNEEAGPDIDSFYLTLGYQLADFMPHITFAKRDERNEDERNYSGPELERFSEAFGDALFDQGAKTYGIEDNEVETITIGLNYNLSSSSVAKIEWMQTKNISSTGFFEYATKDDKNNIFKMTIEAIF